MLKLDIKLILC